MLGNWDFLDSVTPDESRLPQGEKTIELPSGPGFLTFSNPLPQFGKISADLHRV